MSELINFPKEQPAIAHDHCAFCARSTFDLSLTSFPNCLKCTRQYCPEHSSKLNPAYCQECFGEVVITDKTYVKTEVEYDEAEDCLVEYKKGCRKISFAGADWVFYNKAIHLQTDEELSRTFEFHRAMVSQLEVELTQRKVNKATSIRLNNTNVITVKKTTEVRSTKETKTKQLDLAKLAQQLAAKGISPEQLASVLGIQMKKAE